MYCTDPKRITFLISLIYINADVSNIRPTDQNRLAWGLNPAQLMNLKKKYIIYVQKMFCKMVINLKIYLMYFLHENKGGKDGLSVIYM